MAIKPNFPPSSIGMAVWTMIPGKIEEEEPQVARHLGVLGATLITFFLAEMGDKTKLATVSDSYEPLNQL